jgi:hypothetical protein
VAVGPERAQRRASPRSGARAVTVLRSALLALPLAALGLHFALALADAPPRVQTGDALFDAMLAETDRPAALPWGSALLEQTARETNYLLRQTPVQPRVDAASPLGHLDARFIADPRYWLALHHGATFDPPAAARADLDARGLGARDWFLEEAQRRGVVSTELLVALLGAEERGWRSHAAPPQVIHAPFPPPPPAQSDWPLDRWRSEEEAYRTASAGRLDPLLRQLLAIGQGDAAACYVAARCEAARGDLDRAQALLAQGNRLPVQSSFMLPDPAAFWHCAQLSPQAWEADQLALGGGFSTALPNYTPWRDLVRKLAYGAAHRGDRAGLQDLHVFVCRLAQNGRPVGIHEFEAISLLQYPSKALQAFSPQPLTADDWRALSELQRRRTKVKTAARQGLGMGMAWPPPVLFNNRLGERLAQAEQWLSPRTAASIAALTVGHALDASEQASYEHAGRAAWEEVAGFDYRTMQFAPGVPRPPAPAR